MFFKKTNIVFFPLLFLFIIMIVYQTQAQDVYPGWAFYSSGRSCYLYDVDESLVHTWASTYNAAGSAHLMRDSSVLFSGRNPNGWSGGVLQGGQFQIIKWDGEVVWDFNYACSEYCPHHNFEIVYYTDDQDEVPHVLASCYEKVSGTSRLPDKIVEIEPTGRTTGEVVWEWHAWDHRTNDPNNHPELFKSPSERQMGDWTHINSVSYNRELDQIVLGVKSFYEFVIIDHSTTTEEAAGHSGGDYGMGGDLLYRWGRASNYGCSGGDYLSGHHGSVWIPKIFPGTSLEVPGGGNVIIYHNNRDEVTEVIPPGDGDGIYPRDPNEAWGPSSPTWTFDINASSNEGSVQRLPNGNTFICNSGRSMYEVTPSGQEVWRLDKGGNQAHKYAYSYLNPETYAKKENVTQQFMKVKMFAHPNTGNIHISFGAGIIKATVAVFDIAGKKVHSRSVNNDKYIWNVSNQPSGMYIVQVSLGDRSIKELIQLIK